MNEAEYMKSRVDDQIGWYDRKSIAQKKFYFRMQVIIIISSSSIPLINVFGQNIYIVATVSSLGALVAILSSVITLYRFRENWVEYRSVCEMLKQEKLFYETRTRPYDGDEPFKLFVQRVESLISQEHTKWRQLFINEKKAPQES